MKLLAVILLASLFALAYSLTARERQEIECEASTHSILTYGRNRPFTGNLQTMIPGKSREIGIIARTFDDIRKTVLQGRGGNRYLPNWRERLDYFAERVAVETEAIMNSCSGPNHKKEEPAYEVELANNRVAFYPVYTNRVCLCQAGRCESMFYRVPPSANQNRGDKPVKTNTVGPNGKKAQHHIVPHFSLVQFFGSHSEVPSGAAITGCTKTMLVRQRNMEKMMLYQHVMDARNSLPSAGVYMRYIRPDELWRDDHFEAVKKSAESWTIMGGNIFEGPDPKDRGPFDPKNWRSHDGFEDESMPIIGRDRHRIAKEAHQKLKDYLARSNGMSRSQKRVEYNKVKFLYQELANNFLFIPLDPNQWVLREPTDAELR